MKISRMDLLNTLTQAGIGLTTKPILEQSDSYVFTGGELVTFNDEILCRTPSPLGSDMMAAVNGEDFRAILAKFPDEEVDITFKGGEVIIKGQRRQAGIRYAAEIVLPYTDVPTPTKWRTLAKEFASYLIQAARTCGKDASQFLTTCVHVTDTYIEACDNSRYYRADVPTRFPMSVLVPASSIDAIRDQTLVKVSMENKGWLHFTTASGLVLTLRCSYEKYHEGVEDILRMNGGEQIELPSNLDEMLTRSDVMTESGHDARVGIKIEDGLLTISSQKDSGWFRESKRVRYKGQAISFEINPRFLSEVLGHTHKVRVDSHKLKLEIENVQFIVSLLMPVENIEAEEADITDEE